MAGGADVDPDAPAVVFPAVEFVLLPPTPAVVVDCGFVTGGVMVGDAPVTGGAPPCCAWKLVFLNIKSGYSKNSDPATATPTAMPPIMNIDSFLPMPGTRAKW
jgi:hypothetical protein